MQVQEQADVDRFPEFRARILISMGDRSGYSEEHQDCAARLLMRYDGDPELQAMRGAAANRQSERFPPSQLVRDARKLWTIKWSGAHKRGFPDKALELLVNASHSYVSQMLELGRVVSFDTFVQKEDVRNILEGTSKTSCKALLKALRVLPGFVAKKIEVKADSDTEL